MDEEIGDSAHWPGG